MRCVLRYVHILDISVKETDFLSKSGLTPIEMTDKMVVVKGNEEDLNIFLLKNLDWKIFGK